MRNWQNLLRSNEPNGAYHFINGKERNDGNGNDTDTFFKVPMPYLILRHYRYKGVCNGYERIYTFVEMHR